MKATCQDCGWCSTDSNVYVEVAAEARRHEEPGHRVSVPPQPDDEEDKEFERAEAEGFLYRLTGQTDPDETGGTPLQRSEYVVADVPRPKMRRYVDDFKGHRVSRFVCFLRENDVDAYLVSKEGVFSL